MTNLPQELIIEIMLFLPVKPLLRFRCVSKPFCNIFDSSNFINAHIKRSKETRNHLKLLILHEARNCRSGSNNLTTNIYMSNFSDGLHEAKILHNTFKPRVSTVIEASCNGLLLLCFDCEIYALWNPFTRRSKKLPVCAAMKFPYFCWSFGLGYDSFTDDYKVVMISETFRSIEVWVFALKANHWRKVQDFPYSEYTTDSSAGYFADGALHFLLSLIRDNSKQSRKIAVFDMVNESICVKPLSICRTERYSPSLHVVDECLCVGFYNFSMEQGKVYVRNKDGDEFTWSKFYNLNKEQFDIGTVNKEQFIKEFEKEYEFDVGYVEPLAYSMKRDKVLLDLNGCYIFWYDLEEKRCEIVDIIGKPLAYYSKVCWESLVSLGNDSEFDGNFAVRRKRRKKEKTRKFMNNA